MVPEHCALGFQEGVYSHRENEARLVTLQRDASQCYIVTV
jgi:hypothetical protein